MYKCPPGYDIVSAILPFVSSLLCVCSSVLSWKNQCQSWRLLSIYPSWLLMTPLLSFFSFFSFTTWALFLPPLFTVQWQLHPWLDRECAAAKPGAQFLYPECFPLLICVSYLFVWNNQLQHLVMGMSEVLFGCMIYHNCLLTSLFPQLCSVDVFLHALDLTWT